MSMGIKALSEREKDALRLLIRGHDAKSIARALGLSVHTVNDRLRNARRKLQVSSSREAARQLAESEQWSPNSLGGKQFGLARSDANVPLTGLSVRRQGRVKTLSWLFGGVLIVSLIIAAVLMSSSMASSNASVTGNPIAASRVDAPESDAAKSALEWVSFVDRQMWDQSWNSAGALFKSQITAAAWAASIKPVRTPLGAVFTRKLQSATKQSSLPGAPAGEYELVELKTNFAGKKNAVETVVLAHERSDWKVVGYFIR